MSVSIYGKYNGYKQKMKSITDAIDPVKAILSDEANEDNLDIDSRKKKKAKIKQLKSNDTPINNTSIRSVHVPSVVFIDPKHSKKRSPYIRELNPKTFFDIYGKVVSLKLLSQLKQNQIIAKTAEKFPQVIRIPKKEELLSIIKESNMSSSEYITIINLLLGNSTNFVKHSLGTLIDRHFLITFPKRYEAIQKKLLSNKIIKERDGDYEILEIPNIELFRALFNETKIYPIYSLKTRDFLLRHIG